MRSLISLFGLIILLACPIVAFAENIAVTSKNLSGTITVTNTFQSVQSSQTVRQGCTLQNTASNNQWVFFGPIANATKATAVLLAAGQSVSCTVGSGGTTLQDQVSVTGTSGDAYFANFQ